MTTRTAIHDGPLPPALLAPTAVITPGHGACASFLGVVRDEHHGKAVTGIDYRCYRVMAEALLPRLADEARSATATALGVQIVHGTGWMVPGQVSLAIHVSAPHRGAAFDACRLLLERIKQDLPVWKHERYGDGSAAWLEGS
jgi:molybdopterin synthase catalytic subunit